MSKSNAPKPTGSEVLTFLTEHFGGHDAMRRAVTDHREKNGWTQGFMSEAFSLYDEVKQQTADKQ